MADLKPEILPSADAVASRAAELIEARIREAVLARGRAALLVPTGETPRRTYARLKDDGARGAIDFSRVTLFGLDEYWGGRDFADELAARLVSPLPPGRRPALRTLNGLADDWRAEAAAYERAIADAGGIDLCLLGVGVEGHIAFNERGAAAESRTRIVDLAPSTIAANRPHMRRPYAQALTVGLATICAARSVLVLATGDKKAPVIGRFFSTAADSMPLTVLRAHPDVRFLVDEAAARDLPPAFR